jgi:hypothetical protein
MVLAKKDPGGLVGGTLLACIVLLLGVMLSPAFHIPLEQLRRGWGPHMTTTQEKHGKVVQDNLRRGAPAGTIVKYMNGSMSVVTSSNPLRLRTACNDNYGLSFTTLWGFHKIFDIIRPGTEGYEKAKREFDTFKCPR